MEYTSGVLHVEDYKGKGLREQLHFPLVDFLKQRSEAPTDTTEGPLL